MNIQWDFVEPVLAAVFSFEFQVLVLRGRCVSLWCSWFFHTFTRGVDYYRFVKHIDTKISYHKACWSSHQQSLYMTDSVIGSWKEKKKRKSVSKIITHWLCGFLWSFTCTLCCKWHHRRHHDPSVAPCGWHSRWTRVPLMKSLLAKTINRCEKTYTCISRVWLSLGVEGNGCVDELCCCPLAGASPFWLVLATNRPVDIDCILTLTHDEWGQIV